jgi:RNA recognition motif-containing protein
LQTGRSRGFGFVYYEHVEDAKAAKDAMCGQVTIL